MVICNTSIVHVTQGTMWTLLCALRRYGHVCTLATTATNDITLTVSRGREQEESTGRAISSATKKKKVWERTKRNDVGSGYEDGSGEHVPQDRREYLWFDAHYVASRVHCTLLGANKCPISPPSLHSPLPLFLCFLDLTFQNRTGQNTTASSIPENRLQTHTSS